MDEHTDARPNLLWSVFACKCPRCREGRLFTYPNPYDLKNTMKMPECCPVCGQRYELHTGFYFGTGYVSYGLAIVFTLATLILWWLTVGLSVNDSRIFWWLGANAALLILLQPLLQRLARSIWIHTFVRYDGAARLS